MSAPTRQRGSVIIIGDEVLSGKVEEANAAFLIRRCRELGVDLERIEMIPDNSEDIADSVRRASRRSDFVITTGGVGPTHDDITMASVAAAFDREVVAHPDLLALVIHYFGEDYTEGHRRLALVPDGAELLNRDAPWPTVCFRNIYILPGIPKLMRSKFDLLAERFEGPALFVGWLEIQAAEAEIYHHLEAIVAEHPEVVIGSYPRREDRGWIIRVTAQARSSEDAEAALDALTALLSERIQHRKPPQSTR